jgi:O-glycosyl hydrolase
LAAEFVRQMEDPSSTNEARLKALQAACERHSELIRDAMNGMFNVGCDGCVAWWVLLQHGHVCRSLM